jgi:predicted dehydrogenase
MNERVSDFADPRSMIKVGVVGARRGLSFMENTAATGMELVAVCEDNITILKEAQAQYPDVEYYHDYSRFLDHEMDAIVLANYFHEHAELAMHALRSGRHVLCETTAAVTLAECAAVESSGKIYMLAENYAYLLSNQEMRRLYRNGEVGEVKYAEGEYNHPASEQWWQKISQDLNHWRNWIPPTYYCTHALAPLIYNYRNKTAQGQCSINC